MANYIKGTAIQENSISETKLDSSLQSWKETVTNHINNNDNPHNITKSSIGLDNVTNDAQVKRSELGVANGVATLDSTGKVPSGQLPSYVDDVIEGYLYNGVFYKDTSYTTSIVGESGKIYIDLPTNKTYRWTGSVYGVISETIALGETPSTAYRGDRGKIAYDHSQSAHAPSNAQANIIETIKVNGTTLTPNSKAVDITIPTVGNGTITIKQGGTSKGTFTTNQNGNTTIELTDTNTTYTAGDGLSLSGTTFSNNGVRSIATGTTNGTISVNTNGNISNIGVYGLKSAAYTNSSDYATASHTHSYLPLSGGTMSNTNVVTNLNADLLDGLDSRDFVRNQYTTSTSTTSVDANDVLVNSVKHDYRWQNVPTNNIASLLDLTYSSDWRTQLFFRPSGTLKIYARARYNGTTWSNWRELAFIDSNVASATKLANSRTIWGQSFDGTGNVSGEMSDVEIINFADNWMKIGIVRNSSNDVSDLVIQSNGVQPISISSGGPNLRISDSTLTWGDNTIYHSGNCNFPTTPWNCSTLFAENSVSTIKGEFRYIEFSKTNRYSNNGGYINFHYNGSTADYTSRIIEDASGQLTVIGKLRIGSEYTTSNNYTFYVASGDSFFYDNVITGSDFSSRGDAIIDGTVSCTKLLQTSDIKYKTNIKQIEYEEALKIIENLNPVTWDWNENTIVTGSSSGFVAQEAEEFIPNAISRDNENNLSLDYTQLHSYEIRVIQEQQKEIKDLKQRLEVLESLVLQLTNKEI